MRRSSLIRVVAGAALAVGLATVGVVTTAGTGQAAPAVKKAPLYYISMGDSYSVGYQNPTLGNTWGFTGYVAQKERLTLENFGCGGATTGSLFTQVGCPDAASAATHRVSYDSTNQVAAVLAFIQANPGKVGLVTVSISGNDVTSCALQPNPISCVLAVTPVIKANVTNLVTQLDSALTTYGDTDAHIVGITYPDVILGDWVFPVGATNPALAVESAEAFDDLINPTLNTAYTSVARGAFVDVTSAPWRKATAGDDTGTFTTTTVDGVSTITYSGPTMPNTRFGPKVPAPVAEVCELTWYCLVPGDIHANTKGYDFIGKLITTKLASL